MRTKAVAALVLAFVVVSCGGSVDSGTESENLGTGGAPSKGGAGGAPSNGGAAGEAPDASAGQGGAGGCSSDLNSDPLNCGACGMQCIGGECKAGVCQPAPGMDPSPGSGWLLAVDDQSVFLAESVIEGDVAWATLWRTAKQGGEFVKLLKLPRQANGIALTGDSVILTLHPEGGDSLNTSAVISIPKSGGAATALADEKFMAWSPIVYDGELFWIETSVEGYFDITSSIRRLPLSADGQVMSVVEAFPSTIRRIAVDEGRVYFSAWMQNFKDMGVDVSYLYRVAKTGGEEPKGIMGTENAQMIGPVLSGSDFYYFKGPWHETSPMHWQLERFGLSPDGYASEMAWLVEFDPTKSPGSFVVDSFNVYWTRGSEGSHERELTRTATSAKWEKNPAPIATGLAITSLAQDDQSLFFVNEANALVRMAK